MTRTRSMRCSTRWRRRRAEGRRARSERCRATVQRCRASRSNSGAEFPIRPGTNGSQAAAPNTNAHVHNRGGGPCGRPLHRVERWPKRVQSRNHHQYAPHPHDPRIARPFNQTHTGRQKRTTNDEGEIAIPPSSFVNAVGATGAPSTIHCEHATFAAAEDLGRVEFVSLSRAHLKDAVGLQVEQIAVGVRTSR